MAENKPQLDEAYFKFTQEANCMDEFDNIEQLEIKCLSDIGIDGSGGCFYVIKTEGWSIESAEELDELFDRIKKSIFPNKDV